MQLVKKNQYGYFPSKKYALINFQFVYCISQNFFLL